MIEFTLSTEHITLQQLLKASGASPGVSAFLVIMLFIGSICVLFVTGLYVLIKGPDA